MDNKQLYRSLKSIGKECFVKYFIEFSNFQYSNEELIELLISKEDYKESGSRTRVTQSRRIIKAGRANDALETIYRSNRLSNSVRQQAKELRNLA
jgi:hypothetical protein